MFPYYYSTPSDADYFRALAEERAAREQYAAARRAQEEARQRAARARAARAAYASPYSSYYDDTDYACSGLGPDLDMDVDDTFYAPRQRPLSFASTQSPTAFRGLDPYRRQLLMEEQRRRELLEEQRKQELLQLEKEKERRRLEEERVRRILQEERQREEVARQRMLEEERLRRALEEEKLRRAAEEEKFLRTLREEKEARQESSQQAALEPLLRALGFIPASTASDSESERRPARAQRTSPISSSARRTERASPIRQFPFGRTATAGPQARSPSPKAPTPTATTIPITTGRSIPSLAEQSAAAEKIQDAFRAFAGRKHALKSIRDIRKRFLAARSTFTLPTTLDFDVSTNGRIPTTVTVDPALTSTTSSRTDEGVAAPKLAYTPTNAPLHAYEEELNRILGALDAVESRGDLGVRGARRELARAVEREAEHVEGWRSIVWQWWTQKQLEVAEEKEAEVVVAPESAPAERPSTEELSTTVSVPEVLAASEPQAMDVEPVEAQPVEMLVEDSTPISPEVATPLPAPTEVIEQPSGPEVSVELPEVIVTGVQEPELESLSISVEPQLAEPAAPAPVPEASQDADVVLSEGSSRPSTPPLALDDHKNVEEVEMEVEPQEALTPPPSAHPPLAPVEIVEVEPEQQAPVARDTEQKRTSEWAEPQHPSLMQDTL